MYGNRNGIGTGLQIAVALLVAAFLGYLVGANGYVFTNKSQLQAPPQAAQIPRQ